ncbi:MULTISPECIES: outer membrane protein [unclassified Polynucleobacter]|uniref:outer membrane protein n=1 Tax=unclassified Polynucleobacter TaxID=2640945 RepID=UPI001F42F98E|nr:MULTISPECIES: outer membrane beta-barrel protein [unclassified Polynucleobacter]MCE7527783.1 porin family protein [Polynucleobacter sp. IMCC 30228]MCE7529600.1 porin family protein [Polynucleobacter sp. IMCC 29146]
MARQKLLIFTAVFVTSFAANGQSSQFIGAYGQIGVGYQNASPAFSNSSLSAGGQTLTPNISATNATGFTGAVSAGYNFQIAPQFLLGLGLDFNPIATPNATATASYKGIQGSYQQSASVHINNSLNLFVMPAIALDPSKLLYGKVGYSGASANGVDTDFYMAGYSLGLGYKQMIKNGWYGFGEFNYANYGSLSRSITGTLVSPTGLRTPATLSSTVSASSSNLLFGIGYQF